ncbi:hypothetical protein Ancab_018769 [Ancistrocladus abbreviatus]
MYLKRKKSLSKLVQQTRPCGAGSTSHPRAHQKLERQREGKKIRERISSQHPPPSPCLSPSQPTSLCHSREEEAIHFLPLTFFYNSGIASRVTSPSSLKLRFDILTSAMDSLSSVSPTTVALPPSNPLHYRHQRYWRRQIPVHSCSRNYHQFPCLSTFFSGPSSLEPLRRKSSRDLCSKSIDGGDVDEEEEEDEDVERALHLDGRIPGTSDAFVKQVSSRAYDMRRHLQQSFDSSSYDVLDANPWRESSKPVYVLTHKEDQLCTMKTRRNRSEVERELGLLFSKGKKRESDFGNQAKQSRNGKKFQMLVEDIREGILVFEDQNEAFKYCDLLQGGGQGCEGVAEIEASSVRTTKQDNLQFHHIILLRCYLKSHAVLQVFDLCRNTRALAVLFRRGRTPPQPERLKLNLRARKHSLED